MSCTHPYRAFPTGAKTENGKDEYFISFESECFFIPAWQVAKRFKRPFVRDLTEFIEIPCGHCYECKKEYARKWAFRCLFEAQEHEENYFVTLTYNNENLPPFELLFKCDLQNYFKRLRSAGYQFRYIACGEKGEKNHRPHYHVLFFGLHLDRSKFIKMRGGNMPGYRSPELEKHWPFGFVDVSPVSSPGLVGNYISKYVLKNYDGEGFFLMSRKPGIGFNSMLSEVMKDNPHPEQWKLLTIGDGRGNVSIGNLPRSLRERLGLSASDEVTQACIAKMQSKMQSAGYKGWQLYDYYCIGEFRETEKLTHKQKDVIRALEKL